MISTTISHYRILEKIGEGGMGVVYKAEDLKLKRTVALKFLPTNVLISEDEKTRFLHEAQAAAALDHPNICTVYEIDEADGRTFIVMAYLEGKTVKEKLSSAPLSIEEAMDLTMQVAQGLQAAHEKGIVHRDIKSSNILVTEKGQAKIMDFGLARRGEATQLTKTGVTLGTVPYMSPEQSRGEKVDHRTDIWSLGIVLYEMLTSQLPFKGDYNEAILYSILHATPQPVTALRSGIPMELERIIDKCLGKDRTDRYQHADELIVDLRRVQKHSTETVQTGIVERDVSRKKKLLLAVGAVLLLGIIAGIFILMPRRGAEQNQPEKKMNVELNPNRTFRELRLPFKEIGGPALSPDGNWLAFPAAVKDHKMDVFYMNVTSEEYRRITDGFYDLVGAVSISPDGAFVAYDRVDRKARTTAIMLVSSFGGTPRVIAPAGIAPAWRPDGQRIAYVMGLHPTVAPGVTSKSGKNEAWSIKPDGTDARLEFVDSIGIGSFFFGLWYSPDGKSLAWIRTLSDRSNDIIIVDLESKSERSLTSGMKDVADLCWTLNDQIIFSSTKSGNTNLWIVPASGGSPVQLTRGTESEVAGRISRDNRRVIYLQQREIDQIRIANVDGSNVRQLTSDDLNRGGPTLSPDKQWIAYWMTDPGVIFRACNIYMISRSGGEQKLLASPNETPRGLRWSPNGKMIVYMSTGIYEPWDSVRAWVIDPFNPGPPKLIGTGLGWRWINDKEGILFKRPSSLLYSLETGEVKKFFEDSTYAMPIRDGKNIVYRDHHQGREGWWVVPASSSTNSAGKPIRILEAGFESAQISQDGKWMYFKKEPEQLWKISLPDGKRTLVSNNFHGATLNYSISEDGKECVYFDYSFKSKLVMMQNPFK